MDAQIPVEGLSVLELGAAGLFILLVLKIIHDIFKLIVERRNPIPQIDGKSVSVATLIQQLSTDLKRVQEQVHDLHAWHDKEDDDGVKTWYNRKSVENIIRDTAAAQQNLTRLVEALVRMGESQASTLESLSQTVSDLYTNLGNYKESICPYRNKEKD
jgi:septal ring factor EnvC (AmiA/AmiB activator)